MTKKTYWAHPESKARYDKMSPKERKKLEEEMDESSEMMF